MLVLSELYGMPATLCLDYPPYNHGRVAAASVRRHLHFLRVAYKKNMAKIEHYVLIKSVLAIF
jgi:hypothetical protein